MKNSIKTAVKGTLTVAAIMALSMSVQASIFTSSSSISNWVGAPQFLTGAAPTTDSGGTSQDNDNWGGVAGGVNGFGSLAETFVLGQAGQLQNIQMVFAGSPMTFSISLYDLGSALGGYPAVPGQMNFVPTTLSRSQVDLLAAGDQFTYYGTSGQTLYTLTTGENVSLLANEVYAIALDPTASASGTWWVRGGTPSASYSIGEGWNADSATYAYAYQNFEGKAGPYSAGARNFDTAVTVSSVPEPTVMGLMGTGIALGGMLIRRRKA
ncbi:MAG: PEP-CTERM sorting domain-containing protein [Verrucomicrobiota bacterium]|jgi:hypothetical protein